MTQDTPNDPINGWPYANQPGLPLDPDRHRLHWVRYIWSNDGPKAMPWDGDWFLGPAEHLGQGWRTPQEFASEGWCYLGPVLTHDENLLRDQRVIKLEQALGFYADGANWVQNGPLDANSGNFTGGPAGGVLAESPHYHGTTPHGHHRSLQTRVARLEQALRRIIGTLDDPTGGQHIADMRQASAVALAALEGNQHA